jgi:hypothetical protein
MTAVAHKLGCLARIMAIRAAVLLPVVDPAVTGGMLAFIFVSHNISPRERMRSRPR